MPQFDPTYFASQIFWLAIAFTLLYVLLTRLALPGIGAVIAERESRIADDIAKAEETRRQAEELVAAYEAALAKARREATAMLRRTQQELAEAAAREQAEADRAIAARTEEAERRIAEARQAARAEIRGIAIGVAGDIVTRLTGAAIDKAALTRSVDAALKEAA